MKKRYVLYFVLIMFCFSLVKAETCPLDKRTSLAAMASNINVTYEEVTDSVYDPDGNVNFSDYSLVVRVYNMNSQLRIALTNDKYNDEHFITYEDMDKNGVINLRQKDAATKTTYTFKIYGTSTDCYNKLFRTIKLTLPKFNYFSQYSLCNDISEFYMCQKYVMQDFDELDFFEGVEYYKAKKLSQENETGENGDLKDNTAIVSKVAKKISDNKFLVAGVVVVLGVAITMYIVIKRKGSVF